MGVVGAGQVVHVVDLQAIELLFADDADRHRDIGHHFHALLCGGGDRAQRVHVVALGILGGDLCQCRGAAAQGEDACSAGQRQRVHSERTVTHGDETSVAKLGTHGNGRGMRQSWHPGVLGWGPAWQ